MIGCTSLLVSSACACPPCIDQPPGEHKPRFPLGCGPEQLGIPHDELVPGSCGPRAGRVQPPLAHLPQHGSPMLTPRHRAGVDASDVRPGLAVVGVELRPHCELQRSTEVGASNGGIETLPAALALLDALGLLGGHSNHLLRGLVEGREPSVVPEVGEAAAEVEARGGLARAVAAGAEAAAVDPAVARQRPALLELLASHVEEGLHLTLLLQLHQREPAHHAAQLRLVDHLLRQLAQAGEVRGLGRGPAGAPRAALHRQRREALRAAALGPPLPHAVRLGDLRLEDQGPALREGTAAPAVPLLHGHALEANHGVPLEGAVLQLCPLPPDGDGQGGRGVVRDDDVALDQVLPIL
mmetsp:Transcript_6546/g.21068  ORF Transcript_6546/g.21068 Transcript_6546/m.21068 type:complete len:353 (+) Transcript_6546:140-1198(+)